LLTARQQIVNIVAAPATPERTVKALSWGRAERAAATRVASQLVPPLDGSLLLGTVWHACWHPGGYSPPVADHRFDTQPADGLICFENGIMMLAIEKTFMSKAALTSAKPPGNWTQLNKQLAQARTLLRQMSRTVADIEDARTIERAKRANGSKPRIPWAQVKKELQLD
jgi:hypothetical protein